MRKRKFLVSLLTVLLLAGAVFLLYANGSNDASAQSPMPTSAPRIPEGVPDNSMLLDRLEKAGASYDLREALNNPISLESENGLIALLDTHDAATSDSERAEALQKINAYVIPGANEGLPGEIQKSEAVEIAVSTFSNRYDVKPNAEDIGIIRYMAADLYSRYDGSSFWAIQTLIGSPDAKLYFIDIDAKTGNVLEVCCEE